MATPGSQFTQYANPLLRVLKQLGGSARPAEARVAIAEMLKLPDAVLEEQTSSGQSRFENQVGWARFYLVRAGYIDASRRGVWALTEKGRTTDSLTKGQVGELIRDVVAEWGRRPEENSEASAGTAEPAPPDELVRDHRADLMAVLQALPAGGFERLCQRLLREAGFEEVTVTGRSGDGGIDGIGTLQINSFVSFRVLFQCKRYTGTVGAGAVRDFRGAMQGRADKGLILTTGTFSADARREAVRDGVPPLELVDGETLVSLFEQLELGLKPRRSFVVDVAFFDEFRA